MRSWLKKGWDIYFHFFPVLFPLVALMVACELFLVYLHGSMGIKQFPIGVTALRFSLTMPPSVEKTILFLIVGIVVLPILWPFSQFLVLNKISNKGLLFSLRIMFTRFFSLIGSIWCLKIGVLVGFFLLIFPGVVWGITYMFAPLIALLMGGVRDSFSISASLTRGHRGKLFLLAFFFCITDLVLKLVVANISTVNASIALGVWIALYFLLQPWFLGSQLAAFLEFVKDPSSSVYVLSLGEIKEIPQLTNTRRWVSSGALILIIISYLAKITAPLIDPLELLAPPKFFALPSLSSRANLILGTVNVDAIAPFPDGKRLALLTSCGLEIRRVPELELEGFILMDIFTCDALDVSPTGEKVVYTGWDGTMLICASSGKTVWKRDDLRGEAVAFSPKGDYIALGAGAKVFLLNAGTGSEVETFVETGRRIFRYSLLDRWYPEQKVRYLRFNPSGELLLVVYAEQDDYYHYAVMEVPAGRVIDRGSGYATFSQLGEVVIVDDYPTYTIRCFDPRSEKTTWQFELPKQEEGFVVRYHGYPKILIDTGDEGNFFAVFLQERKSFYVVDRRNNKVKLVHPTYETFEWERYWKAKLGPWRVLIPWVKTTFRWRGWQGLRDPPRFIGDCAVFNLGTRLLVWDGNMARTFPLSSWDSPLVALDPGGKYLVGGWGPTVYALPSGTPIGRIYTDDVDEIALNPNGRMAAFVDLEDEISIFSTDRWKQIAHLRGLKGLKYLLGWWKERVVVVIDSYIAFVDPKTESLQKTSIELDLHHMKRHAFAGGRLAFFNSLTKSVHLIDIETGNIIKTFPTELNVLALSLDGKFLAEGKETELLVREVWSGKEVVRKDLGIGEICELSFSPAGQLACGGKNGVVVIDLQTGEELFRDSLDAHLGTLNMALAFNGEKLAIALGDGPILVYFLSARHS